MPDVVFKKLVGGNRWIVPDPFSGRGPYAVYRTGSQGGRLVQFVRREGGWLELRGGHWVHELQIGFIE